MAMADYKCCNRCGRKCFYDSDLQYVSKPDAFNLAPFKEAGEQQEFTPLYLYKLGDWAVLCIECSKTHRTQIAPIAPVKES